MDKNRNGSVAGWVLSLLGFVLLLAFGNLSLMAILVPIAALAAIGMVLVHNHGNNRVTHGIK